MPEADIGFSFKLFSFFLQWIIWMQRKNYLIVPKSLAKLFTCPLMKYIQRLCRCSSSQSIIILWVGNILVSEQLFKTKSIAIFSAPDLELSMRRLCYLLPVALKLTGAISYIGVKNNVLRKKTDNNSNILLKIFVIMLVTLGF
jgi:hypothetical protein